MSRSATLTALLPVHQLVNMAAEAPPLHLWLTANRHNQRQDYVATEFDGHSCQPLACAVLEALEASSYLTHGCRYALQPGAGSSRTRCVEDMLNMPDNVLPKRPLRLWAAMRMKCATGLRPTWPRAYR